MRTTRPVKQTDRALFLAIQADAKEYPGGVRAIGEAIGINGNTLANGINPDHETLPPSFGVILEIIKLTQAKRTIFALCQMVGQIPMDFEVRDRTPKEAMQLFFTLIQAASVALEEGSEGARDGRFDAEERKAFEPLLVQLMRSSAELLKSLRS